MQEHKTHLTIEELAELVAIPVRTIRYYISEGLLPGPEGRGKATVYGTEHLLKLRLIRRLSQQHMPLAEMTQLTGRLSLAEIAALLSQETPPTPEGVQAQQLTPPQEYIASLLRNAQTAIPRLALPSIPPPAPAPEREGPAASGQVAETREKYQTPFPAGGDGWRRWQLVPGVELHIKDGAEEQHHTLLTRIFKLAGLDRP